MTIPSQQEQQQHFDNQPAMNDNNYAITMMTMPSQQQHFDNQPATSQQWHHPP